MEYPKYYRKNGRCLKVLSPTEALQITLPPDFIVPLRSQFPHPERLQEELREFEEVPSDVWDNFNYSFYHQVQKERESKNQIRQQEFEAGKLRL
jgi:hypothetical protein